MKIAFDAQPLLKTNKTGIAYCEEQLTLSYMKLFTQNQCVLDVFTGNKKTKRAI